MEINERTVSSNQQFVNMHPIIQQPNVHQDPSWYRNWRSWVAIILLVCVQPFIGIALMWLIAPWSIKAKRIVAFIFIGLPIIIGLAFYFFIFRSASVPGGAINQAADTKRKADVENISRAARSYCVEKQQCPPNLNALTQKDFTSYLYIVPTDPETGSSYMYELQNGDQKCLVKSILSTGEVFFRNCIP